MPIRSTSSSRSSTVKTAPSWAGAALLIVALTFIAYLPALRGDFIWDDDAHVTRPELRTAHGLYRIWFDVGATQQYYPLLHSAFWFQHKLWGDSPVGYHFVNIALHAIAAVLVMRILNDLLSAKGVSWAMSAAFLTAAVFALHPVHVESVAWITELKNTLSAVFYLSAMGCYLRFDRTRGRGAYVLSAALFVMGLLTKTVTATLPAALLVIFWWQRGRISWRRDVIPLLPWFVAGAAAGLFTAWVERDLIGAKGQAFELSAVERMLLAGRIVWFYLYKLVWPAELVFIYPRWTIDPAVWWQWLFPSTLVGLLAALLAIRRRTRAPLAAMLFFIGSLFPVLGFFNVYPFLFSFVADHFQYLPSLGVIALVCSAAAAGLSRLPWPAARFGLLLLVPLVLGVQSYLQSKMYADVQTLYTTTIERNPAAWMAYNNLGVVLKKDDRLDEAIEHYRIAIELRPDYPEAHNNLGIAFSEAGRTPEAIAAFREALRLRPANPEALGNLAAALTRVGRYQEAVDCLQQALRLDPENAGLHRNLGVTLHAAGRIPDAMAAYRRSLDLDASQPDVRVQLDLALASTQPPEKAIALHKGLLRSRPDNVQAHFALAVLLAQSGRTEEAIDHYRQAIRLHPDHLEAHNNLAALLARSGRPAEAIPHFEQAVRLWPDRVEIRMNLAVAYASVRNFTEAIATAERARDIARSAGQAELVQNIETWIATCRDRAQSEAAEGP